MAINQGVCVSFLQELFQAVHNFGPAPDSFFCALYTSSATINANTTTYTTAGECTGTGYTAGGLLLTISQQPIISGNGVFINFAKLTFPAGISVQTAGCLIYNNSKAQRAVAVFDFGLTVDTSTTGTLIITFPPAGPATAVLSAS